MAQVRARIIVKPTGECYFSDDDKRGYITPKEFIESYNGTLYSQKNCDWITLDKRNDELYIDFGNIVLDDAND